MSNKNTPMSEWEDQYKREYNRIIQAINRQKKLGYFVPEEVHPIKPSKKKTITPEDVERLIEITPKKIRKSSIYIDKETGEGFQGLDVVKSHHVAKPSKAKISEPTTPKTPKPLSPKEISPKPDKAKKKRTKSKKNAKHSQPTTVTPETEDEYSTELQEGEYPTELQEETLHRREYYPGFENIAITGYFQQLKQFPNAEGARIISEWLSRLIDTYGRHAVAVMLDEGSKAGNIVTWETVYKIDNTKAYIAEMVEYLPDLNAGEKFALYDIMEDMEMWEPPV